MIYRKSQYTHISPSIYDISQYQKSDDYKNEQLYYR